MSESRFNPYAPPSSSAGPRSPVAAPGEWIKWIYVALTLVSLILLIVWRMVRLSTDAIEWTKHVWILLPYAKLALGVAWLYVAWSGVPRDARSTASGPITPSGAVFRLLVPFYNLYWIFAVNTLLCDAINGVLARANLPKKAPKGFAVIAAAMHVFAIVMAASKSLRDLMVPLALANNATWVLYMFMCDARRRDMAAVLAKDAEER